MLFAGFNVSRGRVQRSSPPSRSGPPRTSSARGSPTRSATTAASTSSRSTASKLHIKQSHLDWADRWFERYGDATVFFTRMLPIIRTFISLPAGVARMPFWRFTLLTFAGCIPWVLHADAHRQGGRRQLGELEGQPALRRLRRGRGNRARHRLPGRAGPGGASATRARPDAAPNRPDAPPLGRRSLLGALQGPAELLPVSSSGHLALVPWPARLALRGRCPPTCARPSRWRCTPARRRRC